MAELHDPRVPPRSAAHPERLPGVLSGFHVEGDPSGAGTGLLHGGESWASTSYAIDAHRHDGWELYLQADGRTAWRVAGRPVELLPGHVLAVPPGTLHEMVERPSARHHFFYAGVDLAAVGRRHPALLPAWQDAPLLHAVDGSALVVPFRRLVRELGHELPLAAVGISTAVDALVLEATRVLHVPGGRVHLAAVHPAVARARSLLDDRCTEPWTVPGLARAVGLSTGHLAEAFSREIGVAPHRYLVERRVERATELLTGTDLPITAIAHELGFSSSSHFSRVFTSTVRVTPRTYRRDARAGAPRGRGPAREPVRQHVEDRQVVGAEPGGAVVLDIGHVEDDDRGPVETS